MIFLENQVCTPEQSQILWDLGLDYLETNFYWIKFDDCWRLHKSHLPNELGKLAFPAYTVAELGILLGKFRVVKINSQWNDWRLESMDFTITDYWPIFNLETEAQARTKALIILIKKDYLKVEDLKL